MSINFDQWADIMELTESERVAARMAWDFCENQRALEQSRQEQNPPRKKRSDAGMTRKGAE